MAILRFSTLFQFILFSAILSQNLEGIVSSVKAAGMELVGAAYPQDAHAGVFNPAGMADVGDSYDAGLFIVRPTQRSTVRGNRFPSLNGTFKASVYPPFYNPDFAINRHYGCDFTFGLMIYNRGHVASKFHHIFNQFGRSALKLDVTQEILAPVVSYRINDSHSIGIALDIAVQGLRIKGLENFDNILFSVAPGKVTNRELSFSTGVGVTLGWKWNISPCLSVGVSYQPKISMSRFRKYKGFLADRGKLDIPATVIAGVAFKICPSVALVFDVHYLAFNRVRAVHNPLALNLLDPFTRLGTKEGSGFGWKDQTFFRFGVDYQFNDCLTLRAGFRHATRLFRNSQTAANILTNETVRDFVSVGATWQLNCNSDISFFYAHGFSRKVRGFNSVPPILGGGEIDLKQRQDAFGFSFGQCF